MYYPMNSVIRKFQTEIYGPWNFLQILLACIFMQADTFMQRQLRAQLLMQTAIWQSKSVCIKHKRKNCNIRKLKINKKSFEWLDESKVSHFHRQKADKAPCSYKFSEMLWCYLHAPDRVSQISAYIYSLGRLSFKIINSPGRLFLMEERRQYKIGHLLRWYLRGKQKDHQLSNNMHC